MKLIGNHIVACLFLIGIFGCERKQATQYGGADHAPISENPGSVPSTDIIIKPDVTQISFVDAIKAGQKVRGLQPASRNIEAIMEMSKLLRAWHPVGSKMETVLMVFGEPAETKSDRVDYVIDAGVLTGHWTLEIKNGVVTRVIHHGTH